VPDRGRLVPARRSIFVKLVAIMVGMAACIMLLVVGFFIYVVDPEVGGALDRLLEAYAEKVAAEAPDLEAATAIATRLGLIISYQGPRGAWTTDRGVLPASTTDASPPEGEPRYLVQNHAGDTYGFAWKFERPIHAAHDRLLALLLLLIVVVVVLAHEVLRHALRPVRRLHAAAVRIGAGDLDVEIPSQWQDELGALTDAFNQMARRVREMIALRDQLLVDVSHELRSPLTRMKVALALVPEDDKRARMEADVAQMEQMVSGTLELERLRDPRGLQVEGQDLLPLVREVAAPFADSPPGVTLAVPEGPIPLPIDAARIRMLLRNLLENAVKYSLPDSRPVAVTIVEETDSVTMRVADNGTGAPEADLERLFEPFFRADPSRSKRTGGFGLGLSICKRIAEAHGGRIAAENRPDRGLSVVVTLPR
jgi:signal transduction histidine kinase